MSDYVYEVGEIKERVPIEVVAAEIGVHFDESGVALCPFHDDHNTPNFELMGEGDDGYPWAYCRACGAAVDVIELLKRVEEIPFYEALVRLSRLADELPDDVPRIEVKKRTPYEVNETWYSRIAECQQRAAEHEDVGLLSFAYGFSTEDTPLPERTEWDRYLRGWGWGLDEAANIVIPHYDRGGELTAVKVRYRNRDWKTFGALKHLYGSWRAVDDAHSLVLCEGESDCVWAAKQGVPNTDVLALPSGAGAAPAPDWTEQAEGYEIVYLAFDNDVAGNEARGRWSLELGYSEVPSLRDVQLPEGQDLRSHGAPLGQLLAEAERIVIEE